MFFELSPQFILHDKKFSEMLLQTLLLSLAKVIMVAIIKVRILNTKNHKMTIIHSYNGEKNGRYHTLGGCSCR